jgi:hypothetical protein
MNKRSITKWLLGMAIILIVSLNSCTKEEKLVPIQTGNIMAVNALASLTSTPVNFYLDTQLVNTASFAYGNTPNYVVVKPNYQSLTIKNATTSTPLITTPLQIGVDKSYTFFLYGTTATPLVLITQDTLTAPSTGKARVRLVQLGQSVGANLDLVLRNDYQVPAVGKTIVANAAYGTASSFIEVDTCSNYNIQVYLTGTTTSKASSSKLTLLPNINYTILIRGISGGTPALAIQAPINNTVF